MRALPTAQVWKLMPSDMKDSAVDTEPDGTAPTLTDVHLPQAPPFPARASSLDSPGCGPLERIAPLCHAPIR